MRVKNTNAKGYSTGTVQGVFRTDDTIIDESGNEKARMTVLRKDYLFLPDKTEIELRSFDRWYMK